MIPRGKRKKRVGKERKKEKGRRERQKKVPFCFFSFFFLQLFFFAILDTSTLLHGSTLSTVPYL